MSWHDEDRIMREGPPRRPEPAPEPPAGPPVPSAFPPVVLTLIAINVAIFLLQPGHIGSAVYQLFALWPLEPPVSVNVPYPTSSFQPWQLLTYGFLHGGTFHLFVNMFALWMFGTPLEHTWGSRRFLFFFLFCVAGAGLIQLFVASQAAVGGAIYPTVGASGGVFGILLGFGMLFPNNRIMLLIPPIPMKAKYFVIGYGAFELLAGVTGTIGGIAHFAHLGGMLFGFILIQYWRRGFPFRR